MTQVILAGFNILLHPLILPKKEHLRKKPPLLSKTFSRRRMRLALFLRQASLQPSPLSCSLFPRRSWPALVVGFICGAVPWGEEGKERQWYLLPMSWLLLKLIQRKFLPIDNFHPSDKTRCILWTSSDVSFVQSSLTLLLSTTKILLQFFNKNSVQNSNNLY